MNHWIVAPIVLPAILAPFIIMVLRYHLDLQRIFSVAGVVALLGIAADHHRAGHCDRRRHSGL